MSAPNAPKVVLPQLEVRVGRGRVKVVTVGVQGPAGAPGASGAGYNHVQATPAAVWTIPHNLGFRPGVELTDAGGSEIEGDVLHLSLNTVQVTFTQAIAGRARLA